MYVWISVIQLSDKNQVQIDSDKELKRNKDLNTNSRYVNVIYAIMFARKTNHAKQITRDIKYKH